MRKFQKSILKDFATVVVRDFVASQSRRTGETHQLLQLKENCLLADDGKTGEQTTRPATTAPGVTAGAAASVRIGVLVDLAKHR